MKNLTHLYKYVQIKIIQMSFEQVSLLLENKYKLQIA